MPREAPSSRTSIGPALQAFCRGLPGATEDIKWGAALVFSVGGKMFATFAVENPDEYCFNCGDEDFDRLVELDGVRPAPYMARLGWVQVRGGSRTLKRAEAKRLIRASYEIALAKLPKRTQREIRGAL